MATKKYVENIFADYRDGDDCGYRPAEKKP